MQQAEVKQQEETTVPTDIYSLLLALAKTFGFPAVLVVGLLFGVYKLESQHSAEVSAQLEQARQDRIIEQKAFVDALDRNSTALDKLSDQQIITNTKLDGIHDDLRGRR